MPEIITVVAGTLGKIKPLTRVSGAIRQGVGSFRRTQVTETPLRRTTPAIEPPKKVDAGKMVGEVLLPGEAPPQTPEQKAARELLGAEEDNWRQLLGSLT